MPKITLDLREKYLVGAAAKGDSKSFQINLKSNAGYIFSLQSQSLQKLQRVGSYGMGRSGEELPYTITAGDRSLDLKSGAHVPAATTSGMTSIIGDTIPIVISVGSTRHLLEGTFKDSITLTIGPNQ